MKIVLIIFVMAGLLPLLSDDIVNTTGNKYAEQITRTGLEHLGLSPKITIVHTPNHKMLDRNYVTKVQDEYFLYLDKDLSDKDLLRIIPHELLHVQQYNEGRLNQVDQKIIEYDGKQYDLTRTPHEQRPWEVDARQKEYKLKRQIRKLIKNNR